MALRAQEASGLTRVRMSGCAFSRDFYMLKDAQSCMNSFNLDRL
jgi:hypothetical protein